MKTHLSKAIRLSVSVATSALGAGCASLGSVSKLPPLNPAVQSGLGNTIGVSVPGNRAAFSFEKSVGRAGTAGDGATEGMAALIRRGAGSGEGAIVVVALLPVAAAIGAVAEMGRTLPPEQVRKCETELEAGMRAVAEQNEFREAFLQVAGDRTKFDFVRVPSAATRAPQVAHAPEWILDLSVDQVRLQRTSMSDASFALFLGARMRLVRAADGATVYDEPIHFRSGPSLFANWTTDRGAPLRRVAETGYREMAEQIVQRFLAASPSSAI